MLDLDMETEDESEDGETEYEELIELKKSPVVVVSSSVDSFLSSPTAVDVEDVSIPGGIRGRGREA